MRQQSRTEGDVAFRAEVRSWLEEHCPPTMRSPAAPGEVLIWGGRRQVFVDSAARDWLEATASQGWTAPTWPTKCGGAGLNHRQAEIITEEMRRLGARPPIVPMSQGLTMLGPTLLEFGTTGQQERFMPPIARGDIRWCQGFSEPAAGSDLAGLRTHANLDGDVYRVTGHKIWSSFAHESDWIFCLVRTDPNAPKHLGISFLLIDLDSPGVTVKPIALISGESDFCEVFLDDVLVPADHLVGLPGQGWTIAKHLLAHERSMLGQAGGALAGGSGRRKAPITVAREATATPTGVLPDPTLRRRLAGHEMELRALKALGRSQATRWPAHPEAPSILKLVSTETSMRRHDLMMDLVGLPGLVWDGGDEAGRHLRDWLRSRANSIEGGTSEIQLNIIARAVLGPS